MNMRKEAEEADIIIVNHHLFFADLSVKGLGLGTVIPEYDAAIFDEAHLLESIATSYFSVSVNSYQPEEIVQDTTRELHEAKIGAKDFTIAFQSLQKEAARFFQCFANKDNRNSSRYRLNENTIDKKMLEVAPDFANTLLMVISKLKGLKDAPKEIQFLIERIEKIQSSLEFIVNMAEPGFVYWCETAGRGTFLHASPIDVADDMRRNVFEQLSQVVLTSATLATGKNFHFVEERLGLDNPVELIVESPFDHEKQATLYLPKGMPDPNSKFFIREASDEIERILKKSKGRAFVLFTSYKNMEEAHKRLKNRLPYKVLKQGTKSRTALLNEFRKDVQSVLFATSSFWQGVDVQGEALSCVIIDKLPFAVPSDPIVEARIEYLRARSENPFMAYQVPSAVITLKQGLGRLIRSKQDKGILSILDNRLTTKKYGEVFLESLPKCRIVRELDNIDI
jgi:ATP-dependent DNA helicase DinG